MTLKMRASFAGPQAAWTPRPERTGTYSQQSCKAFMHLIAVLTLCACSTAPAPPERFYRVEAPAASSTTSLPARIVVEPFEAYGVYNERPILYLSADASGTLQQYHYQFWGEPPGVMLHDALIAYLRTAFSGAQIESAGGRVRGDYVVHARLKRLEHRLGSPAQAQFAVEFRIVDAADNERAIVLFDDVAPAAGGSVGDFVLWMDQLLGKACAQLAGRRRELSSPARPSS